jgi:glycyl-tRNA synthetase beta chain
MTVWRHLVVELGVEELPSAYLPGLIADLNRRGQERFRTARLAVEDWVVDGTPRRLALLARVAPTQWPETRRVRGPALRAARGPDGGWTRAAEGFAARVGVGLDALAEGRGADAGYVVADVASPVADAATVLTAVLPPLLEEIEAPRTMRWRVDDVRFVRPVRWLVALLDDAVLPITAYGVAADRVTYGNRTDHPGAFRLSHAARYLADLKRLGVLLGSEARRAAIRERGAALAAGVGGTLEINGELLDEVADLVEWPVPFLGRFDTAFLSLPEPVLKTAMEHHQRYFPVRNEAGTGLLPCFVGVRNGEGLDLDQVVAGNERVLKARLTDARFFYEEDLKQRLDERVAGLDGMVYQSALGTYGDKTRRLVALAGTMAEMMSLEPTEAGWLRRAAELAKADLLTHLVGEFPELQGVMGGIYAAAAGEPEAVATAIAEQYRPLRPGDPLPASRVGQALALADRLDTLAGMVARGLTPTGSEDPLAFRRSALGVARLMMDGTLPPVDREALAAAALEPFGARDPEQVRQLWDFVAARARSYLSERYRADLVDACLAAPVSWNSLRERLDHLTEWSGSPDFAAVLTTFKRVVRIAEGAAPSAGPFPEGPEAALGAAVAEAEAAAPEAELAWGDCGAWARYWAACRALKEPVDRFFDAVLVMDPDPDVRARRLGLVARVARFLGWGADLGRVTGERREDEARA